MSSPFLRVLAVACVLALGACTAYQPIETTPEGITRNVAPGDTVRVLTRDDGELELLVTAINRSELRGRVGGKADDVRWIRFDRIETLEIEQLSMRRTLLTVVLPVVAGAIIACNNDDCRTHGTVDATF